MMKNRQYMKRVIAIFLALNILFEVISPSVALALTSGPSQPEMQSFEPVGTTEMVDLFSGDFNYNVPLLTVPGPNGGYPVNLAYHSGIGMEDEASWVGLGWNINAGVITRELRGLPDDFNGDLVNKKMNMNPNWTAALGFGFPLTVSNTEIFGLKYQQSMNLNVTVNNYQGIGYGIGTSGNFSKSTSSFGGGFSLNYNSLSGETSLTPNFGLSYMKDKGESAYGASASLGFNISSLGGIKSLNFNSTLSTNHKVLTKFEADFNEEAKKYPEVTPVDPKMRGYGAFASGAAFAGSAFTPHSSMPQTGFMVGAMFGFGTEIAGIYTNFNINGNYSLSKYAAKSLDFKSYGYIHSEGRRLGSDNDQDDYSLMDFNREKDASLNKDIPSMPVPMTTYDVYMVKGQGIGGAFRPFRNDIGILHDPEIKGKTLGATLGLELGAASGIHVGFNGGLSYASSYSGPWRNMDSWNDLYAHQYNGKGNTDPLYENVYFRNPGELTANRNEENDQVLKSDKFPIKTIMNAPDFSGSLAPSEFLRPLFDVRMNNDGILNTNNNGYRSRRSRSQLMSQKTIGQINAYGSDYVKSWVGKNVYDKNVYPRNSIAQGYTYETGVDHHIGEMTVTNPDGNRYIYALPAYNHKNKEASFSIEKGNTNTAYNDKIINYNSTDASTGNTKQDDHFFASTELPAYAHAYMLTTILSPDYVDLTGNGPTEDDFGYYVKFNYTKTNSAYHWRMPYEGANFLKGNLSSDQDDKAGYTYGEKEIWYLNSIETKTHIAEFKLSGRTDGYGAGTEHQNVNAATYNTSEQLSKLDEINLYSKNDPSYTSGTPIPIKTVHFEYSYDLCKYVRNNSAGTGKLTLKKVWFSYLKNNKGALSPYVFDYHENIPEENPIYDIMQSDRWGNYKTDHPARTSASDPYTSYSSWDDNTVNPYTPQYLDLNKDGTINAADATLRNQRASAWTLKRIVLPSGGEINVNYEQDDYAYVQDKPAMQMMTVYGFGNTSNGNSNDPGKVSGELKDDHSYLFFELEDPGMNVNDVHKYTDGISELHFKAYLDLKKNGVAGVMQTDYVEGYAEIETGSCGISTVTRAGASSKRCGWLKLKPVNIKDKVPSTKTHAFRKAAWQHMKIERHDLLFPASNNGNNNSNIAAQLTQTANSVLGALQSITQLSIGFYSYCHVAGYAKNMTFSKPSFVRLNSPDKIKFGGSYRVQSLTISDTWSQTSGQAGTEAPSQYGQSYTYRMPDGTSSGVASYEPQIGSEEIPHHMPIRYSSPYFILKNQNLYIEEPIGESYFPAPMVGYSRVVVKSIDQKAKNGTDITRNKSGISVYEFYTSKDFPVQIDPGDVSHKKIIPKIPLPFIGNLSFEDHGFSQRIRVETNDMHGKSRSVAVYPADADINDPNVVPLSKSEFIYSTKQPYTPNARNTLKNTFDVLFEDGAVENREMGITHEFFTDMRESSGVEMKQGIQGNIDIPVLTPPVATALVLPIIDYSENMYKSIVSMEVVNKVGVLLETRTTDGSSTVSSKHLLFDGNTGGPLLTTTTNNFNKPIYSYAYAANWSYTGLDNAFRNIGATVDFDLDNSTRYLNCNYSGRSTAEIFTLGDEVLLMVKPGQSYSLGSAPVSYWVKQLPNSTQVELIDEFGNRPPSSLSGNSTKLQLTIMRSGRRNQQSVSNGQIVSLINPVTGRSFSLFNAYNQTTRPVTQIDVTDCADLQPRKYDISTFSNTIRFTFFGAQHTSGCWFDVNLPSGVSAQQVFNNNNYQLKKAGKRAQVYDMSITPPALVYTADIQDGCGLSECLDGVLQASAAEFKDSWTFDYEDIGNPQAKTASGINALTPAVAANNPYRYGTQGIWRSQYSNVYQDNRQQTGTFPNTNISTDGTFSKFVLFDWLPAGNNKNWTRANTVTMYSPYGFELENKNALDIYTSAIYGYRNSVPVAITSNAAYHEAAFDGFEENLAYMPTGHVKLQASSGSLALNTSNAHTGAKSLALAVGQSASIVTSSSASNAWFLPVIPASGSQRYTVTAWFKAPATISPQINVTGASVSGMSTVNDNVMIEGWRKVETTFTTSSADAVTISFSTPGSAQTTYLDDVRIQPFKSGMKTYVYDPRTLWLLAELDNQNYATFYNYDEEGTLVQVKKETVRGVQTLQATRSNVKR